MKGENPQESIYDAVGMVVIRVDSDLTVCYVNTFGLRLFGYSRLGQVFRKPLTDLLGVDAVRLPEFLATLREIASQGGTRKIETPLTASDGRRLWISWSIEHRASADTILAPIFLIGADVTALNESVESAVLFLGIAQNNPLSIIVTNAERTIVFANAAALLMTGYSAAEVLGSKPEMFRSGLTSDATYREMWEALGAGSTWNGEFINQRKEGGLYTEKKTISPIAGQDGCIRYYVAIGEDLSAMHDFVRRLEDLGHTDALTGLRNRAGFLGELTRRLRETADGTTGIAVVHVDVDDFETFNRRSGHADADRLLVEIGRRLGDSVREVDLVARLGSDEFGLLLAVSESPSAEDDEEVASRLLAAIRQPFTVAERSIEVTSSIGIAHFPADGAESGELLARAASATQEAKRAGGDSVARFDQATATEDSARRDVIDELRHAVEREQLLLHYQPQVSLLTGAVIGLEALVRWQHPDRGLIPPGRFIPAAEESGIIVAMGEWILCEACRQMRRWLDAGFPPIKVAVDLSARHFRCADLHLTVRNAIEANQLDPRLLEIEITEGAMMHDVAVAARTSRRLKEIGVRLSLDDFGTGYSSLAYLSRFPIDVVKIDQSFVFDITTNPTNAAIAQATIAMSHKLGKVALAEGVETEEQMNYLRRSDCDEMQGYYFSPPLPPDEIATLRRLGKRLTFGTASSTAPPTVLLVDDEPHILASLKRLLRREGYRVLAAGSGDEALTVLAREQVDVIVSDQRMPQMTGTEFLARARILYPRTVRMVLSGYSEISAVTDAINKGAVYRYLNKPWDDEHLRSEIREAFRTWKDRFGGEAE